MNAYKVFIQSGNDLLVRIVESEQDFEKAVAELTQNDTKLIARQTNGKKILLKTKNIITVEEA